MATTKANNSEYQKSLAQYQAVAEYAQEVFAHVLTCDDVVGALTAKQVAKDIFKKYFFDYKGTEYENLHTIEAEGMNLTTCARDVFMQLGQLEDCLKIKKADRAMFLHTYEVKDEDVAIVCTLPDAKIVECAAEDKLRPVMEGVYLDTTEKKWVAATGHVLVSMPAVHVEVREGKSCVSCIIPKKFVEAHAGKEVKLAGEYAYSEGARVKCIEGRYPNWKSVIPTDETMPIHVGSAWAKVCETAKSLAKMDECKKRGFVLLLGKKGEKELHLAQPYWMVGAQIMHVEIDGEIPFDFCIGMQGAFMSKFHDVSDIYLTEPYRAMLYVGAETQGLQMPMMIQDDDTIDSILQEYGLSKDWKAEWNKKKVKDNKPKPADTPAPVQEETKPEPVCEKPEAEPEPTPEAPAPVQEETKPEPVCETPQPEEKKGAEACINGEWVKVEVLTTNGTRAMVRKENGQRAIVKLEDIRGNIVDNTADAPSAAPEAPAPEPVCETKDEKPTVEAVAEEIGTKYADEKVYIATYTAKSFILTGNTKPYHKQLKKYGLWYKQKEGWIFSNTRREYVEKLLGDKLVAAA